MCTHYTASTHLTAEQKRELRQRVLRSRALPPGPLTLPRGRPIHKVRRYLSACQSVVGVPITRKQSRVQRRVKNRRGDKRSSWRCHRAGWAELRCRGFIRWRKAQLSARAAHNTWRQLNVSYLVQTVRSSIRATHEVVDFVHVLEHV